MRTLDASLEGSSRRVKSSASLCAHAAARGAVSAHAKRSQSALKRERSRDKRRVARRGCVTLDFNETPAWLKPYLREHNRARAARHPQLLDHPESMMR